MQEHNTYKKELVYNRAFARPELVKQAKIVEGFLAKMGRASSGVLQISGLIDDSIAVGDEETTAYEIWLIESIKQTGKLEIPADLAGANGGTMNKRVSRITETLTSMPPKPDSAVQKKQRP